MGGPTSSGSTKITWNNNFRLNDNFQFNPDIKTFETVDTYLVVVKTDVEEMVLPINFIQQGNTKYTFKHTDIDPQTMSEVAYIQLEFQYNQEDLGTIFVRKNMFRYENENSFVITLKEYLNNPTPPVPPTPSETGIRKSIVRFTENDAVMVSMNMETKDVTTEVI